MKVLSLLQPWATLVVIGAKKIETRSFFRAYRGPLLIHASNRKIKLDEADYEFYNHLFDVIPQSEYGLLPYGKIIGQVNLVEMIKTEMVYTNKTFYHHHSGKTWDFTPQERSFGNYALGRFGWLLSDAQMLDKPIPAKGMLGLWDFDIVKHLRATK